MPSIYTYIHTCRERVFVHIHMAHMWKSENKLQVLVLTPYGSRDGTRIVRLSGKHLYPLSHLAGQCYSYFCWTQSTSWWVIDSLQTKYPLLVSAPLKAVLVGANKAVCGNQWNCGLWSKISPVDTSSIATFASSRHPGSVLFVSSTSHCPTLFCVHFLGCLFHRNIGSLAHV